MTFWFVTSALALAIAALLALVLLRPRAAAEPAAARDLQVYRDQLRDVDRDLARGVIGAGDAERVRVEISRRILAADAALTARRDASGPSRNASVAMAALLGVILIGGSLFLYQSLGAPGYGDLSLSRRIDLAGQAHATRPDQAQAEASLPATPRPDIAPDYLELMEKLRKTVAQRPDDLQGHQLLARNEAALGNFAAAHAAQAEVLRLKGDQADAADYSEYADKLILAAGGYVSPKAEAALEEALKRNPHDGPATYYYGLMKAQTGRPDLAFRDWARLLQSSKPSDPWVPPILAQIDDLALRAGVEYTPPPAIAALSDGFARPGPTAEDMEAASDMDAGDRDAMIRSMVQRLSDRLASEGGPPADWARLIGALGVLGDTAQAKAILENARQVFAGNDDALTAINAAAREAGVSK